MHKDALLSQNIKVRKSEVPDIRGIQPYLSDLENQMMIQRDMDESIKENASKKIAFSVFCKDTVIFSLS
jgi:predicted transcriptional regulator